jgi:hypothetical protein
MMRRDLAPIIARVIVEHPPKTSDPEATIVWALRTWPNATYEEAHRALRIASEMILCDFLVQEV